MVKMALQKLTRKHTPACPTSRIHVLIDLVVDFVRFLVILLVRDACEEIIFVVWILKLSVVGPHPTNQSAPSVVPFNYSKLNLTVSQITTCSIPSRCPQDPYVPKQVGFIRSCLPRSTRIFVPRASSSGVEARIHRIAKLIVFALRVCPPRR